MAVSVSNAVLVGMGHRQLAESEFISAQFHALHIFEVRGLRIEEPSFPIWSGCIGGRTYELGIGASVNAVCQNLVQDDLTHSEEEWQQNHNCTPPYVVIHFGPTKKYAFDGTHAKFDMSMVHTFDGFSDARVELKSWGDEVLPSLLVGLASSFSLLDQQVKFLPTDRAFYGVTDEGQTVIDTRFELFASAYGSTRLTADQVFERLDEAARIAGSAKQKVVRFFHLALNENDPLKRFLYFFLAIEIDTHATFAKINHREKLFAFIHPPAHATTATQTLFDGQIQRWTNLRERFVWCVICAWPYLSDDDVNEFKKLKTVRDEIAHGSLSTPPHEAVISVEKLAVRLQLAAL